MSSILITDTFKKAKSQSGKSTQHKKQVNANKNQDVKKIRSITNDTSRTVQVSQPKCFKISFSRA